MILHRQIDMDGPAAKVERWNTPLFAGDRDSVELMLDIRGEENPTVVLYAIRADGATVMKTAERVGDMFRVTFDRAVLEMPGRLQAAVKVTGTGGRVVTVFACDAVVVKTATDALVDPERVVPSLEELLERIGTIDASADRARIVAERLEKMTVRGTPADHFGVEVGANDQGGLEISILGGVGVKGDKGDKGDRGEAGGVASVNGIGPDDDGAIIVSEKDIPGAPLFRIGSGVTTAAVNDGTVSSSNAIAFDLPFPAGYSVMVMPYFTMGSARFARVQICAAGVTVNGFNARIANESGAAVAVGTNVNYFAIGYREVRE